MNKSAHLNDLLKCVRCGSCKAYCPTYDEDATEAMGARGRLALLREFLLHQLDASPLLNEKLFSCILCEACSGLCPSGVDITKNIYYGRRLLKQSDKKRRHLRLFAKFFMNYPDLTFKLSQTLQYILSPYLARKGFIPPRFKMPQSAFKNSQRVYKPSKTRGRVAVFTGCSANFLYPHLGVSLTNILLKSGYEVIIPSGEVCCGMPLRTLGMEEEAIDLARRNMRIFGKLKVEAVVSLCPACILAIKKQYPKMIGSGIHNAMDISSFLFNKLDLRQPSLFDPHIEGIIYHDPCHLMYGLGVKKEPRELLKRIGAHIIEKKDDGCCGFGGVFSLTHRDISNSLLRKRMDAYLNAGAKAIVTSCPGCMFQLSKSSGETPVFHIVELAEEAYCGSNE